MLSVRTSQTVIPVLSYVHFYSPSILGVLVLLVAMILAEVTF